MVEEKEEDGLVGEEVEFLNTTVTVSRLPSVQFPEPAHKSKGTRLVDRWVEQYRQPWIISGLFRQV